MSWFLLRDFRRFSRDQLRSWSSYIATVWRCERNVPAMFAKSGDFILRAGKSSLVDLHFIVALHTHLTRNQQWQWHLIRQESKIILHLLYSFTALKRDIKVPYKRFALMKYTWNKMILLGNRLSCVRGSGWLSSLAIRMT